MIDINLLRDNPKAIQKSAKDKNVDIDVNHILEIDKKYKELSIAVQKLREERNVLTSSMKGKPTSDQIEKGKLLKEKLEKEEHALKAVGEELKEKLYQIPNLPLDTVPVGDPSKFKIIKKIGTPKKLNFAPLDHLKVGEALDIIDVQRGAKVSGTRFAYLKNEGALLELALIQFAIERLVKESFNPVFPPMLIRHDVTKELGLKNADVVNARVGATGRLPLQRKYDFVTARAVGKLDELIKYALPLLKKEGYLLAYKSKDIDDEIKNAKKIIEKNNLKLEIFSKEVNGVERKLVVLPHPCFL